MIANIYVYAYQLCLSPYGACRLAVCCADAHARQSSGLSLRVAALIICVQTSYSAIFFVSGDVINHNAAISLDHIGLTLSGVSSDH